jgi:hypothetical protein
LGQIVEYAELHTTAFVDRKLISLSAASVATTLPVPASQGGSLDVDISVDLSTLGRGPSSGEFGVALRSPLSSLSAALTIAFNASAPDVDGTRWLTVRCSGNIPAPLPRLAVLKGEPLTVRALIDRPYIEVFLQGGRIAFVVSPAYNPTMTAVRLFNGYGSQTNGTALVANVSVHGMACGWSDELPQPRAQKW